HTTLFRSADPDCFELSNLNRQVFASLDTLGRRMVDAVHAAARAINPELELETYGAEWTGAAYGLLERYPIVINAMDDIPAGVLLYRKARDRVQPVLTGGRPTEGGGCLFNRWDGTVERPRRGLRAFVARRAVRRWIRELGGDA